MQASFQSSSSAITVAPMTRNGARTTRRMSMATASCNWFTSLVMRVISDGVPIWSISPWERVLMCWNISERSTVPKPWLARAAQYWQISAQPRPTSPSSTITPPMRST